MKRHYLLLCLIMLICVDHATAQLQLIKELDFPERAILVQPEFDRFRYAKDGDWHILSALIAGKRQSMVYHEGTGEVKNTNYVIENPWVFDSGRIYPGWPVDNLNAGWTYLHFNENGQFTPRTALPAFPQLISGNLAYGFQQRNVYEMDPFGFQNRILFTLPHYVSTSGMGWQHVDDMLYIAHRDGVFVYNLSNDSLTSPFDGYIQEQGLVYVPYTAHKGKFLFKVFEEQEGDFTLHEVGHGVEPREIPSGAHPPAKGPVIYSRNTPQQAPSLRSSFRSRAVANGGDLTWMTYFTEAASGFYTSHLLRIDRSALTPGIDEVGKHTGKVFSWYHLTPTALCLEDGSAIALGWFGPNGSEPYGQMNDQTILLSDFYEGERGSVNYASAHILNMPSRLNRYAVHNGMAYFPVIASYFGTEIAVSDGTTEGTQLLADLEPGIRGLRAVEFNNLEEDLYFAVQKDDLSFAIYRQGPALEPPPQPSDPNSSRDWELMLANEDGSQVNRQYNNYDAETPVVQHGQIVSYLSPRLDPPVMTYPDTSLNQQLIQIEMGTGLPFREKKFAGGTVENSKLLPGEDGAVNIIRLGGPSYRDSEYDVSLDNEYTGRRRLFMVQFDSELDFQDIKRLLGTSESREYDLLVNAYAVEDGFVLLARQYWERYYWLLHFSNDGVLKRNIAIPRKSDQIEVANFHQEPDGGFQVIMYETRHNCEDCELRILRYDPELELRETWVAHVAGKVFHPRLFDMDNGERWLLGAADGTIHLPGNRGSHLVQSIEQGNRGIFALRWLNRFDIPAHLFTYEEEIFNSYPAEFHDGNLFMSYIRSEYSGQEIFQGFDFDYFSAPDRVIYEVAQLDSDGHLANREEMELNFDGEYRRLYPTSIRTDQGKWIRGIRAGSYSRAHFDMWKDPKPYYHDNFANRIQLFATDWPFVALPTSVRPSEADADGSHMHIFPNPNNGEFFIVPRGGGNEIPYERFHIHDMQGRLVFERNMQASFAYKSIQLPANLAEGVYHVVFTGPDVQESLRLVLVK